jgi:hypothetical protein
LEQCHKTTEASLVDFLRFCVLLEGKCEGKAVLKAITAHVGLEIPVHAFLTSELLEVSDKLHDPAGLPSISLSEYPYLPICQHPEGKVHPITGHQGPRGGVKV